MSLFRYATPLPIEVNPVVANFWANNGTLVVGAVIAVIVLAVVVRLLLIGVKFAVIAWVVLLGLGVSVPGLALAHSWFTSLAAKVVIK